jgi:hypothetical protein
MKRYFIKTVLLLTFSLSGLAQQNVQESSFSIPASNAVSIDSLSSYIKRNFQTDSDKARAIYLWITNNINYDVPRYLARDKEPKMPAQTTLEIFTSKYAVCQGYSDLFVELCSNVGIKAFIVGGYGKKNGVVSQVGHAWVAAIIDGAWYLFDPTWGAGYVNNDTFFKRLNDNFYKVLPAKFILDHMPFDPMFQLLSYPLTNREFIEGLPASGNSVFNFNDSIRQHAQLTPDLQFAAALRRMEAAGIQNSVLAEHKVNLKLRLEYFASKEAFFEGQDLFNKSISLLNQYISHKNVQFSNITDKDLKQKVDSIEYYVRKARSLISGLNPRTDQQRDSKANTMANIDKLWTKLISEQELVGRYLATSKEYRKQFFRKF